MSLVRIVSTRNKRVEELLERIALALERLAPEETGEVGELIVEEIGPVLEPDDKQKKLDDEEIAQYWEFMPEITVEQIKKIAPQLDVYCLTPSATHIIFWNKRSTSRDAIRELMRYFDNNGIKAIFVGYVPGDGDPIQFFKVQN